MYRFNDIVVGILSGLTGVKWPPRSSGDHGTLSDFPLVILNSETKPKLHYKMNKNNYMYVLGDINLPCAGFTVNNNFPQMPRRNVTQTYSVPR